MNVVKVLRPAPAVYHFPRWFLSACSAVRGCGAVQWCGGAVQWCGAVVWCSTVVVWWWCGGAVGERLVSSHFLPHGAPATSGESKSELFALQCSVEKLLTHFPTGNIWTPPARSGVKVNEGSVYKCV